MPVPAESPRDVGQRETPQAEPTAGVGTGRQVQNPIWSSRSHRPHLLLPPQVQTRNIRCLPDVLVINCEVNSSKEADFWKTQAEVGAAQQTSLGFAACPGLRRRFRSGLAVSNRLPLSTRASPAPFTAFGRARSTSRAVGVGKDKKDEICRGEAAGTAAESPFPSPARGTSTALGVPRCLCPCHRLYSPRLFRPSGLAVPLVSPTLTYDCVSLPVRLSESSDEKRRF